MSHIPHRRVGRQPARHRQAASDRLHEARRLCHHAALYERPLDLERWGTSLLGRLWERRHLVVGDPDADLMLVPGIRLCEACAAVGGREGKTALTVIGQLDRGSLGRTARDLAASVPCAPLPSWMPLAGNAKIVRALAASSPGDGEAVLLEAHRSGEEPHMVAAFISEVCGGIAKHLGLIRAVDPSDPAFRDPDDVADSASEFREVDPALACDRVRIAIERTDATMGAPVGESFSEHRALALARVTPPSNGVLGIR